MKRIGIILESTDCSKFLFEIVSNLAGSSEVDLFFLINRQAVNEKGLWARFTLKIKTRGLIRALEIALYRILIALEHRLVSMFYPSVRDHHRTRNIAAFNKRNITRLNPTFSPSGLTVRYPESDIQAIKALNLDLMVRGNAPGIFKGDIIQSSNAGIISFHHGDNRWNRGGPPGFWEVYLRKPSTGFVVQILTEELDGGLVLLRGDVQTQRTYTQNIDSLYNAANEFLSKVVVDYVASDRLPVAEERTPFGESLLMVPTFSQSIWYLSRTGMLLLSLAINRLVLRKKARWGVAYVAGPWRDAPLRRGVRIKNPANHFYADPFVVEKNHRTVCFLEDYSYEKNRACIAAVEIIDKNNYEVLGPVIEEDFHMSFPYLFEYGDELLMVPESAAVSSIRLYRCIEFPMKWEFHEEVMSDVSATDSMIFENNGRWWLFTNVASEGNNDHGYQLMAYYSDRPVLGQWIPHQQNPLRIDSNIARNGGILDIDSGSPVRCRQRQGFAAYGESLTLARITELTPSSFSEQEIGRIEANFFPDSTRAHHFHSNDKYSVYDFFREEWLG